MSRTTVPRRCSDVHRPRQCRSNAFTRHFRSPCTMFPVDSRHFSSPPSLCLSVRRVLLFCVSDVLARLWREEGVCSLSVLRRSIYYHWRPSFFSRPMRCPLAPAPCKNNCYLSASSDRTPERTAAPMCEHSAN